MDEKEMLEHFDPGPEPDPGPALEPEDPTAPYRAAKEQRQTSAAIIAEHDNLLADMLFELTMNELEG